MKCAFCELSATVSIWMRPKSGGPRRPYLFCSEECKQTGLQELGEQGYKEAQGVLGWDIFIPMWRTDK